jgi:hypothetical protein
MSSWRGACLSTGTTLPFTITSKPTPSPTQPSIQWVPLAVSPRVKRQGYQVDHSIYCQGLKFRHSAIWCLGTATTVPYLVSLHIGPFRGGKAAEA